MGDDEAAWRNLGGSCLQDQSQIHLSSGVKQRDLWETQENEAQQTRQVNLESTSTKITSNSSESRIRHSLNINHQDRRETPQTNSHNTQL